MSLHIVAERTTGIRKALRRAKELWPDRAEYVALAYHVGVTPQAVYNWEEAGGIPTTRHAQRVSELTGVPVAELVPPLDGEPLAPTSKSARRRARASQKDGRGSTLQADNRPERVQAQMRKRAS